MLGWMLIFALMLLSGATAAGVGSAPGMTSSLVFGFLLAVSAFTMVLRTRV